MNVSRYAHVSNRKAKIGQGCQNWCDVKSLCLLSHQCPSKHMQLDKCNWMLTIFFSNWKFSIKPILMTNFLSSTFNHHSWHLKNFSHPINSGHWSNKWENNCYCPKQFGHYLSFFKQCPKNQSLMVTKFNDQKFYD
jgi:hypothetical protein